MQGEHNWLNGMLGEINMAVAASARAKLNLAEAKLRPEHFYASLPLCVIDAVYSIGVNYVATKRTVVAWAKAQSPEWPMDRRKGDREHTISEFLEALRPYTVIHLANNSPRHRFAPHSAPRAFCSSYAPSGGHGSGSSRRSARRVPSVGADSPCSFREQPWWGR